MSVADEKKRAANVESAIRSLYDKFKDPSANRYSCSDLKTKEIKTIKKKIDKRQKELDADKQLSSLKKELKDETCKVMKAAKYQHERIDELLRKFQVRGVSPDLLDEIDDLAKQKPVFVELCGCDDGDEE